MANLDKYMEKPVDINSTITEISTLQKELQIKDFPIKESNNIESWRTELKKKYELLEKQLSKYHTEIITKCEKSRNEGKGSFGWKNNNPDLIMLDEAIDCFEKAMASLSLIVRFKENANGLSDNKCIGCVALRFNSEKQSWYCQEECEDK